MFDLKLFITLISFFFILSLNAQQITGIWRGRFLIDDKKNSIAENAFNFELQVLQNSDGTLRGITYSYKVKEYYGKADFTGIINLKTNAIVIKESKITEVEKNDKTEVCLMICNLKYSKNSKGQEFLAGTFTSKKTLSNQFCFSGKVSLQRVITSSFPKEPFLQVLQKAKRNLESKEFESSKAILVKKDSVFPYKKEDSFIKKNEKVDNQEEIMLPLIPSVLVERENKITARVKVNVKSISVLIFDNGIIDNDTISVYLNAAMVIDRKKVSLAPLVFNIKFDDISKKQEILAIADNLGDIPPNTALMIIEVDKRRVEIPIMANFRTNAKVIIEYDDQSKVSVIRY